MTSRETRNKCWVPEIAILLAAFAIFPCGISVAQASSGVEANLPTAPSALAHPESGGAQEAQFAPSAEASVNGTVMDAGGALVPGAKIEVDSAAHEDNRTVLAGDDGVFQVNALKPGEAYVVHVSAEGE